MARPLRAQMSVTAAERVVRRPSASAARSASARSVSCRRGQGTASRRRTVHVTIEISRLAHPASRRRCPGPSLRAFVAPVRRLAAPSDTGNGTKVWLLRLTWRGRWPGQSFRTATTNLHHTRTLLSPNAKLTVYLCQAN